MDSALPAFTLRSLQVQLSLHHHRTLDLVDNMEEAREEAEEEEEEGQEEEE